jgi:hypothetical protein
MGRPAQACLGVGLLALLLSLINQFSAAELTPPLVRASVLASLLAVGFLLVATLWTRAVPKAPERASLEGFQGLELDDSLPESLKLELAWGSQLLLTATPGATVLLYWRQRTLLRRGLLGHGAFLLGPISQRALATGKAISMVNLALYPGRDEFAALPVGLPALVVQPIGNEGVLLLGGWSPRCFSRSDELWLEGWARKLRTSLEELPDGGGPQGTQPVLSPQGEAGSAGIGPSCPAN